LTRRLFEKLVLDRDLEPIFGLMRGKLKLVKRGL
jgi:hypothetical protein